MKSTRLAFVFVLAVFLSFTLLAHAQTTTQSTFSKQFYTTQPKSDKVLAVDLNNDGVKDIVTADQTDFLISVQLSDGNGASALRATGILVLFQAVTSYV